MYGRSLSICVMQLGNGDVDIEDVEMIIASTCFETYEEFLQVIEYYKKTYWSGNTEKCKETAIQLWNDGKIYQPRLYNNDLAQALYNGGVWVETLEECVYVDHREQIWA